MGRTKEAKDSRVISLNESGGLLRGASDENQILHTLSTALLGRAAAAAKLGKSYGTDRDLYAVMGYVRNPKYSDYYARFDRQDIASRIVEAPPDKTWRKKPVLTENIDADQSTPLELAWQQLTRNNKVFHYLLRADKISGIGQFGILFLGFDDTEDISKPVIKANNLIYMMPFSEDSVGINTWVQDSKDERFGLPESYTIQFSRAGSGIGSKSVHHSRVLHIAEGRLENEVFGIPRLKKILNRLQDVELIAAGSSEMFWRGAFPGYGFKLDSGSSMSPDDLAKLKDEIDEYMHGLKRYIRLRGLSVESLAMQVADPSKHYDMLMSLIAGATGMPKRILTGSERGELASSQDKTNWDVRIEERRIDYAEPLILRPFSDKLIDAGVLPPVVNVEEGYTFDWPDMFAPNDKEQADIARIRAEAIAKYVSAPGADLLVPAKVFLIEIMGFSQDKANAMEDETQRLIDDEAKRVKEENEQLEKEAERSAKKEEEI